MKAIVKKGNLISVFLLLIISFSNYAEDSVERIFWDKIPLRITLPIGKERMVTFPSSVRLKIPGHLSAKLRTQSNQGTVYWLAKEMFDTQRIEVHERKTQQIYLIDLKARKASLSLSQPVEVLVKDAEKKQQGQGLKKSVGKNIGYAALTRFAANQLYAPGRLQQSLPETHRSPVDRKITTYLMMGEIINAKPIASWKNGKLYVTAVELRNLSDKAINLDPRVIRGQWLTATFHDAVLHPAGMATDSTALYLVSDRPFHEARIN